VADLERLIRYTIRTPELATTRDLRDFIRRMTQLAVLIGALLTLGTLGFVLTLHWSVWEAFVLSLDTVGTLGSIPLPHDTGAEIVKVVLLVVGAGTLGYALITVTEFFVAGHLGGVLEERRNQRRIDSLSDHYIICGYGRVGQQVARDLRAADVSYVIVDDNPEHRDAETGVGVRLILARPSDDESLRRAGIERARAVIACVDSDAENIFITLTARDLRNDIAIVARASSEDSERKLRRAGADRVISPYKTSGTEMARLALHPQVTGVVDIAAEYQLEEIVVAAGSRGVERTVGDVRGGAFIVGLRHADGKFTPAPAGDTSLCPGDVLMAIGTPRTLQRLEDLFRSGDGDRPTVSRADRV
jgi:voltage-gated potassium channel